MKGDCVGWVRTWGRPALRAHTSGERWRTRGRPPDLWLFSWAFINAIAIALPPGDRRFNYMGGQLSVCDPHTRCLTHGTVPSRTRSHPLHARFVRLRSNCSVDGDSGLDITQHLSSFVLLFLRRARPNHMLPNLASLDKNLKMGIFDFRTRGKSADVG